MRRNNLLSIGELSKLTNASISSLRYYERKGVLTPALIDPDSGYRYYKFEQIFHVMVIILCIDLDIPLKSLLAFTEDKSTINYSAVLAQGKKNALEKLEKIQSDLEFIESAEKKITWGSTNDIYTRTLSEKYLHVIPYDSHFESDNSFEEVAKAFLRFEYLNDEDYHEFSEFGLLYEYNQSTVQRYLFVELSKNIADVHVKVIPAGNYSCIQNTSIRIEESFQIFREQLSQTDTFLAIETPFFSDTYHLQTPKSELRVMALDKK